MRLVSFTRWLVRLVVPMGSACLLLTGCSKLGPVADHHQHVFSPDVAAMLSSNERAFRPLSAADIVRELDRAGIDRAVLLSVAYLYAAPGRVIDDAPTRARVDNDWTAAQAAAYPTRLVAFCGINPLTDYALDELARCARTPGLQHGIKLHFGNSDVQLDNPEHMAKVQRTFAAANANRMAIVVHLRASISRQRPYGAPQVRLFLDQVMPHAPDVPVQVAHFAGSGPGYSDVAARDAMREFAAAASRREPSTKNLWFDVASIVDADISPAEADIVVGFVRAVGPTKVLFGSDAAVGTNLRPAEAWAAFRRLPLSREELAVVAANVAPYLK